MAASKIQAIDVLILDTAGRTTIDTAMMSEAQEVFKLSKILFRIFVKSKKIG